MIEITNITLVDTQLELWLAEIEKQATEVVKGLAIESFRTLLMTSAQFTGDFAANWNVSVGNIDTFFKPLEHSRLSKKYFANGNSPVFIMGSGPAINEATRRNTGKLDIFRLGDSIFISNSSAHDEPYANLIEDGVVNFRPGNQGMPVATTMASMRSRYGEITQADSRRLARKKL